MPHAPHLAPHGGLEGPRGQSVLEYVLVIAVAILALVGIQMWLKAAVMGAWKSAADGFGFGRQYAPRHTVISVTRR